MRSPRIALLLLTAVLMAPLSAQALLLQFCTPDCVTDTVQFRVASTPSQTSTDATGVTTTSVPIASFVYGPFTITATVTSQQSGTLQRITFNPTTVTANAGTTCSTAAPCLLEIIATSDVNDFPTPKPVGGYPAGVFMMGSFAGAQAAGNGDTISMTGEASGLAAVTDPVTGAITMQPVLIDVINNTPAAGPANTGVSLPSACTGNPACKFTATSLRKAFSTQISETVQQACGSEQTQCPTMLRTHVNVALKNPGNRLSLPIEHVTTNQDPLHPEINPTEQLAQHLAPQFGSVDVDLLAVFANDFVLTAKLKLPSGDTIDPSNEEVFLSVGDFSMTILPGKFKRLLQGKLFTFVGKIDGRDVAAMFVRGSDPTTWGFIAGVHGVQLTGLPQPPMQVPVQIGIGTDVGSDLVAARFF